MKKSCDISLFSVSKRLMYFTYKTCPIYIQIYSLMKVLLGIFLALNTVVMNNLLDAVSNYVLDKIGFMSLLVQLLLFLGCIILIQVLNGTTNVLYKDLIKKVSGKITKELNMKSSKIEAINFEDSDFHNNMNKAVEGVTKGMSAMDVLHSVILSYIPYFLIMGIYLYNLKPILVLSIAIIFIPITLSHIVKVKLFSNLEDKVAPLRREHQYYEKCIMDREYFKETRILGCFGYFKNLYNETLSKVNHEIFKTNKRSIIIELSLNCLTLIGYISILLMLVNCTLDKSISIGAFGAVFGSLDRLVGMMEEMICWNIGKSIPKLGTVKNLIKFLDMEECKGEEVEINEIPYIDVKGVSFSYPGSTKKSLSDVSFHLKEGETVAIVGENGSGKSTLIRLLTGIYLPTEGKIEFNGHDTKTTSRESIVKNVSGVFQKFQRYKMKLDENISISDTCSDIDNLRLDEAVNKADIVLSKDAFKSGYKTMLSCEFDGIDLSGGQWQRVAIARGFYKKHNMIVLDEPTAAIDPIEETKLYNKFKEMCKGKTSVIVTHRLGSTKIADNIIVLDKGKVLQIGTHNELINKEGKYKEMYEAQSKGYVLK